MSRRIATGIDIGTHQTKVVVVEEVQTEAGAELHIIGTGISESRGMRHGYVVDSEDAAESVRQAKLQAERAAHVPIRKGFLAIGGVSLDEVRASLRAVSSRRVSCSVALCCQACSTRRSSSSRSRKCQ